jgi:Fe-S-cluster containining protein
MAARRDSKNRQRTRRPEAGPAERHKSPATNTRRLHEQTADKARQAAYPYLNGAGLAGSVTEMANATRDLALKVMAASPKHGKYECASGCAFCCHTSVTVSPPEAFAIAAYLAEQYSPEELAGLRQHWAQNAATASEISREDYIARLIPCGLLTEDGNCRAHPVRPIACASFLSTSRQKCEDEFHRRPNRDPVPTDKFAMVAGLGVSQGLMSACRKAGVDGEFYELHHALLRIFDTPDARQAWAQGHDIFAGCLK